MMMDLSEPSVVDEIVALADEHAEAVLAAIGAVSSMEMLHKAVSGSMISFLADVVVKVASCERQHQ